MYHREEIWGSTGFKSQLSPLLNLVASSRFTGVSGPQFPHLKHEDVLGYMSLIVQTSEDQSSIRLFVQGTQTGARSQPST